MNFLALGREKKSTEMNRRNGLSEHEGGNLNLESLLKLKRMKPGGSILLLKLTKLTN
jgi:hypothetical protein